MTDTNRTIHIGTKTATDVAVPSADYKRLFIDGETGHLAQKNPDGTVVSYSTDTTNHETYIIDLEIGDNTLTTDMDGIGDVTFFDSLGCHIDIDYRITGMDVIINTNIAATGVRVVLEKGYSS